MIRLGSTDLIFPSADVLRAAETMLPGAGEGWWIEASPPGALDGFGIGPTLRLPPTRRLGEFAWPVWGMSRWAVGHFLASALQADSIRLEAFGLDGTQYNALTLRLWAQDRFNSPGGIDPRYSGISDHIVFALPPKPIAKPTPRPLTLPGGAVYFSSGGLYLITVVDRRYFLQYRSVPTDLAIDCDSTWTDLYATLFGGNCMDVPVTVDKPASAYLSPHPSLLSITHRSAPMVTDAIAASIGQRIVAYRDGTFHAMNPGTAVTIADNRPARDRLAGGELFADIL